MRKQLVARKNNKPLPWKPRRAPIIWERKQYNYDTIPAKTSTEPPCPTSYSAKNHVPHPYMNLDLTDAMILEIWSRSTLDARFLVSIMHS